MTSHTTSPNLSEQLFEEAKKYIPGGVNSPVRAFRAVGGNPFFVQRARGSKIYDVDGREFIDYVLTWGPAILGHAPLKVSAAIHEAAKNGTSFGIPSVPEVRMAKLITECYPSIEKVRMVNSGTEACMSCIRLARGFTGRDKIIKFSGCYHGHVDSLLVKAGSGALTLGYPDSAGIPADLAKHTIVLPYNDRKAVEAAINQYKGEIAALIVESIPANAGLYLPEPGYVEFLRKITGDEGIVFIFDEVMTGFRLSLGGYQQLIHLKPDLTALGKILGGGLPVGAFGGKREIMDQLAPLGPVYQAGTLSGNPLAMAAGITTIEELKKTDPYPKLNEMGEYLATGTIEAAKTCKVAIDLKRIGSMFCIYFTDQPVKCLEDAQKSDTKRFARFFNGMLNRGIYIAPSQFEAGFLSTAHTDTDVETTLRAIRDTMAEL